jgi:predicted transcriptional regulator
MLHDDSTRLVELTARIVSAYVSGQALPKDRLVELIGNVHERLACLEPTVDRENAPAVPVSKSVRPDYLVCLEDGLHFRTLKRHLAVCHGLTPEEYRAKWNLPANSPMVAPNYSRFRSEVARAAGLGGKR